MDLSAQLSPLLRSKRAQALIGVGASLVATVVVIGSCASEPVRGPAAVPTSPFGVGTRAPTAPEQSQETAPLALDRFSPILLEPQFAEVHRAVLDDRPDDAYRAFETALKTDAARSSEPEMQMQRGRLAEGAKQWTVAIESYAASASRPWALTGYAHYAAGRAALGSGDPKRALQHLEQVGADLPLPTTLHRGEALMLQGDAERAIVELRSFLGSSEQPEGWVRASLLLAELLAKRHDAPSVDDRLEALQLARRVAVELAGTDRAREASELEKKILAGLPSGEFERHRTLEKEEQLIRLQALADARKWGDVGVAADELLSSLGKSERYSAIGCEALLLRNKALAGKGEWGKAVDAFEGVLGHCKDEDLLARALFLAGRYAVSDKRYSQATRLFARLENEVPSHRLADDARIKRASAFLELGDAAKFTSLLMTIAEDYPDGDVSLDGTFELALRRIEKRDWAGAANVLERGIAVAKRADQQRDHEVAGRERYYLARAWIETGEKERGLDELAALIRDTPLSYYMQHAYSRLAEADPERAERALAAAKKLSEEQPFEFAWRPEFDTPAFQRAFALLRLGDVAAAAREIDSLGAAAEGAAPEVLWSVALLYDRAGSPNQAQQLMRGRLTDWLRRWPAGDWRKAWELGFPRPFHSIVQREAKKNELPEALIYAVMREESVFDPRAISHADAYGLMQLIESTAKHFSKKMGVAYRRSALLAPRVNIALGAKVLRTYSDRFPENPLLGIPSYNAGPGRPKRWLKERPELDLDVWVELIPFRETRRYTKRVLASRGAYAALYEDGDHDFRLPIRLVTPEG